jgi:hypothetical protein
MRLLRNVMMPGMRRLLLTSALLLGAATTEAQSASGAKIDPTWLRANAASKTAEFKLVGGLTELNGGMNFNGFSRGGLVVTVPQGWNVVLHFKNQDPNLPHSVEVIPEPPPLGGGHSPEGANVPSGPVPPAFDDATSGRLDQGFSAGQGADVRFVARKPGALSRGCGDVDPPRRFPCRQAIGRDRARALTAPADTCLRLTSSGAPHLLVEPCSRPVESRVSQKPVGAISSMRSLPARCSPPRCACACMGKSS